MRHVETRKLTAFLLSEQKLSEEEEGHLLHCTDCMRSMVDASSEELDRQAQAEAPSLSDSADGIE
jgi:hypothetical protein